MHGGICVKVLVHLIEASFIKPGGSTGGADGDMYSVICSQADKMVFIVYNFFKKICLNNKQKCQDLTAEACGVSTSAS